VSTFSEHLAKSALEDGIQVGDEVLPYNFVVMPQVLIFEVAEIKSNLKIDNRISSRVLNSDAEESEYHLLGVISKDRSEQHFLTARRGNQFIRRSLEDCEIHLNSQDRIQVVIYQKS
jgi:hypothetical protein